MIFHDGVVHQSRCTELSISVDDVDIVCIWYFK